MLLALDTRTMYSDGIEVEANKAGVTLTFTQASGKSQTAPVARVGMSTEQAEEVMRTLCSAPCFRLSTAPRKLLPPPKSK